MLKYGATESDKIYAFKVDENGFISSSILVNKGTTEYNLVTNLESVGIYIKPQWNGEKWIEGESELEKQEREYLEWLESSTPTPSEVKEANLEIKIITLLMEMELI